MQRGGEVNTDSYKTWRTCKTWRHLHRSSRASTTIFRQSKIDLEPVSDEARISESQEENQMFPSRSRHFCWVEAQQTPRHCPSYISSIFIIHLHSATRADIDILLYLGNANSYRSHWQLEECIRTLLWPCIIFGLGFSHIQVDWVPSPLSVYNSSYSSWRISLLLRTVCSSVCSDGWLLPCPFSRKRVATTAISCGPFRYLQEVCHFHSPESGPTWISQPCIQEDWFHLSLFRIVVFFIRISTDSESHCFTVFIFSLLRKSNSSLDPLSFLLIGLTALQYHRPRC